MFRIAHAFGYLLAVNFICCDVRIYDVAFFCIVGNVVCNPQIVIAGFKVLCACNAECAVAVYCHRLSELLAVLLAPCHLLVGIDEQLA